MKVALLGAGGGGASALVELGLAGHDVNWWARSEETLDPHKEIGGVDYEGVFGEGRMEAALITTALDEAIADTEAAIVTLPTTAHAGVARALVAAGWPADKPVILNPGHTGGALEFAEAWHRAGGTVPPIVEFSTLTYVARKYSPGSVTTTGKAGQVRSAVLGGGDAELELASALFAAATPVADVLASDLCNVNMVLHAPGAVLGASWAEATGGDFTFYVEGLTDGVARIMEQLDRERLAVARAFGHELPNLIGEMQRIGTVEADVTDLSDYRAAVSGGVANAKIKAPDSLEHRYYREDFGHGLLPFIELAAIAGVEVPIAQSLYAIGAAATGNDYRKTGRTAEAMGIAAMSKNQLIEKVRGQ